MAQLQDLNKVGGNLLGEISCIEFTITVMRDNILSVSRHNSVLLITNTPQHLERMLTAFNQAELKHIEKQVLEPPAKEP
jgi:hypothetical protein